MSQNLEATGTSKDQTLPPGTVGGDWWFELIDGPDPRAKAAPDLTQPVVFLNVQPGTYRASMVRLAANGNDNLGDEVFSAPFEVTADVVLQVAAGLTVQVIQGQR